jgi:hypothetical protein
MSYAHSNTHIYIDRLNISSYMQKHPPSKSSPNLVLLKIPPNHHKSKQPPLNQKLSVRTSLEQRLNITDQFIKTQNHLKPLRKPAQ